ncbi:MAG TPA: choice-of-anchor J domain-containing protein, partial [Actinomycetota bacterium]|nr:choice-of-anchor J domain-containing protein [Actinomycetota bacterium]
PLTPKIVPGKASVGDKKWWLAIDDVSTEYVAGIYPKLYRLRGRSRHMEVWSAADSDQYSKGLRFPDGDCRNDDPSRIRVTKADVRYFMKQFETNMFPKESAAFSRPPKRNGTRPFKAFRNIFFSKKDRERYGIDGDYWQGKGRRVVVLVDNVRDANFYDTDNANTLTRIGGFHYSVFNEIFDRNVMSIDSWDWKHQTRANPPHEPSTDPCTTASASPYGYEGTFAHEYQHLLEYYEDIDETIWVDEGLADWAQTLTGYVDPSAPMTDINWDSHIQCMLGWIEQDTEFNPIPREGGPENSLTWWEDQTENESEILCDYGAAYTMMEFLQGRYGNDFMKRLHRSNKNGLKSLNALLAQFHPGGISAQQVIHEWAAMLALDGILDDGATLTGGDPSAFVAPTLDATINWANDDAYSTRGAPPNGSDYVRAQRNNGDPMTASEIDSISFDGSNELDPKEVEWTVDTDPPAHTGNAALYSGSGPFFDRSIATPVTVPQDDPTLSFETYYEIEPLWDFGFVQISNDGGETWTSLSNASTTGDHDPAAEPDIVEQMPGFTGNSGGGAQPAWVTETFDLSAYAGQDVHIAFRYMTDQLENPAGWWVDDVTVGGTVVSDGTSLAGWETETQVNPEDVFGFNVQIVAYNDDHSQAWLAQLPLDENFDGTLEGQALRDAIGDSAETVGIIVTFDEPTELLTQYAPYALEVNNFQQPGGQ